MLWWHVLQWHMLQGCVLTRAAVVSADTCCGGMCCSGTCCRGACWHALRRQVLPAVATAPHSRERGNHETHEPRAACHLMLACRAPARRAPSAAFTGAAVASAAL